MALEKTIEYKTLPVNNAYHKIIGVDFHDEIVDGKKVYYASLRVRTFTDDTKDTRIKVKVYSFSFESENDLTYPNFYASLKTHEDFENAIDLLEE